jgi:hypothetical protein
LADFTANHHWLYVPPSFKSDTSNATHTGMMLMRICAMYERRAGILAFSTIVLLSIIVIVAVGRQFFFELHLKIIDMPSKRSQWLDIHDIGCPELWLVVILHWLLGCMSRSETDFNFCFD